MQNLVIRGVAHRVFTLLSKMADVDDEAKKEEGR